MMNKNPRAIFPILTVMLFDQTCLSIIFPVMTFVFFDTHSRLFAATTSEAFRSFWYGVCLSLPHLVNMVTTPCLSALSDRLGRRKIILLATLGAIFIAITGAVSVFFGYFSLFMVGCVLQGFFSRTDPIAIASIGDVVSRDKKVIFMGYLQTAISLGAFIGPLLGGYFANRFLFSTFNFSIPFLVALLFAGVGFLIAFFYFKETLVEKPGKVFLKEFNLPAIRKVFSNSLVLRITLILLLSQFSWRIYYQYIPPILKQEFGLTAHQLGLFVGLIAFWLSLATAFGIKLLEKFFVLEKMLMLALYAVLFGLMITILCCSGKFFPLQKLGVWLAVIPIAMGDVIAFSCITAMYSDAVPKADQGKVMGVCFIVVAMIWALTGFLGGILMSVHPVMPLVVAPAGVVVAIFLLHRGIISARRLVLVAN